MKRSTVEVRCAAFCLTALSFQIGSPALAAQTATVTASSQLDELRAQISYKELELMKLDTRLRMTLHPRSPWGSRRWFFYQVTNTSLTAVGAFLSGTGRFSYLHRNRIKRAPKDLFEHAGWYRVGANIDMTVGPMIEIAFDQLAHADERRKGIDLPTLRKYGAKLQSEIDRLIEAREQALVASDVPASQRAFLESEGTLFKDVRDVAVNEFDFSFADAKANRAVRTMQIATAIAANATSGACAYVGNVYASQQRRATPRWKTRLGGTGGVGDVIAGSIGFVTPFLMRAAGHVDRMYWLKASGQKLDGHQAAAIDKLVADNQKLAAVEAQGVDGAVNDRALFDAQIAIFKEHHQAFLNAQKMAPRRFAEQVFVNGTNGGAKINNGIGGLVANFRYTRNAHERFEVGGATNLAYGVGYSITTLELIRNQLVNEHRAAKARQEQRAPEQILSSQLQKLESIQANLSLSPGVK